MENGVNLLTLFAKIGLDSSEFHSGLKTASSTFQSFGDRVGAVISTVGNAVTTGLTLASGAAVAFGTDSVNVGKQFDAAMANVASISGAAGEVFDKLREKAIEMGGSTKFSATEAANAMGYMAMAGWKTEDMLDGVSGIMNLAAASGTDLATTADIVTDALTAFGLPASDSGHFADVLAVASSNANTNVQMMGESRTGRRESEAGRRHESLQRGMGGRSGSAQSKTQGRTHRVKKVTERDTG